MDEQALNDILDKKWDQVLDALPDDALQKLNDLPESEVTAERIYQIVTESGIDLNKVLSEKEEK